MELNDHERIWCSSVAQPVDAEKPTATSSGKYMLRSTVALTWYMASPMWRSTASSLDSLCYLTVAVLSTPTEVRFLPGQVVVSVTAVELTELRSTPMWFQ